MRFCRGDLIDQKEQIDLIINKMEGMVFKDRSSDPYISELYFEIL
jgi:hypothetical protein